jgi:hypothetical protein
VTLGAEEGVEVNLLGLNLGLDFTPLRLRLPFIGIGGQIKLQRRHFTANVSEEGVAVGARPRMIGVGRVLGVTLGAEEGVEVNLLGLNLGLDFTPLRLRLPNQASAPALHGQCERGRCCCWGPATHDRCWATDRMSLLGVLGVTLGAEEGVEVNLLGLNLGLDFTPLR